MHRKTRWHFSFCASFFLALFLCACHTLPTEDKLQAVKQRGVLLVGATGDYQPMSFLNPETKKYTGFDTVLAEDFASSLGVRIVYVPTTWPTLMADTLTGKFDMALCGITITEARKQQALMSNGYLGNGKTLLCRAVDVTKYPSLEAINRPEVRVMENPGGLNEKFARANLPKSTLIIHPVNEEIPRLIAEGKADVMITEIMEAEYYVNKDPRLAAPLLETPFTQGLLGALMPPGNDTLLNAFNRFLDIRKHRFHKSAKLIGIIFCFSSVCRLSGFCGFSGFFGCSGFFGFSGFCGFNGFFGCNLHFSLYGFTCHRNRCR